MQPVLQELPTLHGHGGQGKATEGDLGEILNKEGQCDTLEWFTWRGSAVKNLEVFEVREERGWARPSSEQSDL